MVQHLVKWERPVPKIAKTSTKEEEGPESSEAVAKGIVSPENNQDSAEPTSPEVQMNLAPAKEKKSVLE